MGGVVCGLHKTGMLGQKVNRETFLLAGLFFLAFAVRLVYLNQITSSPYFDTPQIDALWHHNWAKEIAAGDWIGKEVFFRAPLYPYFLGMVYALFGESFYLAGLIQIIIGSLSCVLIFLLAKKLFNATIGIIASVIASFYAPLIYHDAELLIPVLIIFLDLALILFLLNAKARVYKRWWLLAGVVLGFSAIARPNILIFVPFVLLWICFNFWRENKNRIIPSSLFFLLGSILIISPVTIRNWTVEKDFVLISSQGGINFFIGNNPISDGKTAKAAFVSLPLEGYKDNVWITSIRLAEKSMGKKLKPSEISNFWFRQGLHFIKTYPLKFLQLLGKKLYYFWNSYEIEIIRNIYFFSRWSSVLRLLLWDHLLRFPFGIISPLAIFGIILSAKFWKKFFLIHALILSYMFSVILFFVTSRHRLPVVPFLIIFASYSVYWLVEKIKNKQTRPFFVSLSILLPLFLVTNSNLFGVRQTDLFRSYDNLGSVYAEKGQYDSAIAAYQKGLEINPDFAELHRNLGHAYWEKGYRNEAMKEYEQAINLNPNMAQAYAELGYIYGRMNRHEEALQASRKALEIDPTQVRAHISLAFLFEKKELYEEAVREYQEVLRFEPEIADIHNYLGYAYVKLDQKDKALAEFRKALQLDPNYVDAHVNLGTVYLGTGEYEKAIAQYNAALKINPKMIQAYYNLAVTYLRIKEPVKAIEVLKEGLRINPGASTLKKFLEQLSVES